MSAIGLRRSNAFRQSFSVSLMCIVLLLFSIWRPWDLAMPLIGCHSALNCVGHVSIVAESWTPILGNGLVLLQYKRLLCSVQLFLQIASHSTMILITMFLRLMLKSHGTAATSKSTSFTLLLRIPSSFALVNFHCRVCGEDCSTPLCKLEDRAYIRFWWVFSWARAQMKMISGQKLADKWEVLSLLS